MTRTLITALLFAVPMLANASPVLLSDGNGKLYGANNVVVEGSLYNVRFSDGSCVSTFGGCASTASFTFQTEQKALAASQSLLDSVFINSIQGNFDSLPNGTLGCSDNSLCMAMTPLCRNLFRAICGQSRVHSKRL